MIQIFGTMRQSNKLLLILFLPAVLWSAEFSTVAAAPVRQGPDVAVISTPASNAVLQGAVDIVGSADHPSFQFYIVEFHPEPVTGDRWQIIGDIHETPVSDGVLETWDTTIYPDGSYTLRLRAVRLDGNYSEAFSQQVVLANAQPIATDTPAATLTPQFVAPTITPTDVPPTPIILVEQPVVDTPTPRPIETSSPLEDPDENGSFIPTVSGISLVPLRDACLYGAGLMLIVFLFFGFLSALRLFFKIFIDRGPPPKSG
jgi:hypothetical protein